MDLLDLKLDLGTSQAKNSPSTSGQAKKSTENPKSVAKVRSVSTPAVIKTNKSTKAVAKVTNTPKTPNIPNNKEKEGSSARPQRAKNIRRFSPTPDSRPKKKADEESVKGVTFKLSDAGADIRSKLLAFEEFELPGNYNLKVSARTMKILKSASQSPKDPVIPPQSPNKSQEAPAAEASPSRAGKRKITPNLRFPALNLSSQSLSLSSQSADIENPKEEVKEEDEEEQKEEEEEEEVQKRKSTGTRRRAKSQVEFKEKEEEKEIPLIRKRSASMKKKPEKVEEEEPKRKTRKSGGMEVVEGEKAKKEEEEAEKKKKEEEQKKIEILDRRRSERRERTIPPSTTPINPNSALAIKQRIAGKTKDEPKRGRRSLVRKDVKKVEKEEEEKEKSVEIEEKPVEAQEVEKVEEIKEEVEEKIAEEPEKAPEMEEKKEEEKEEEELKLEVEEEPKIVEKKEKPTKKVATPKVEVLPPAPLPALPTPSPSTTSAAAVPTRSSRRVSKPNRLYSDGFDIDRSVQNIMIKKVTQEEEAVEKVVVELKPKSRQKVGGGGEVEQEKKAVKRKSMTPAKAQPEIRNGLLVGYIPSQKPQIENIEDRNDVHQVIDKLLLDVCEDGVEVYLAQQQSVQKSVKKPQKSAQIEKEKLEKRKMLEAKKLEIQMKPATKVALLPSPATDEGISGKRRRTAPVKSDMYMYPTTAIKRKVTKEEEKEADPDFEIPENEIKAQKARDFLAKEFGKEMEKVKEEIEISRERIGSELRKEKHRHSLSKKRLISLEEYMSERDVQNRPETGIRLFEENQTTSSSSSSTKVDDYFYHELITDIPTTSESDAIDVGMEEEEDDDIIDIGDIETMENLEEMRKKLVEEHEKLLLKCHGDSLAAADRIEQIMARPTKYDGSIYTIEDFMHRSAEQSVQRTKILDMALKVVKDQYILETTPPARPYNLEAALYTQTNANAQKLKNLFQMYDQSQQALVQWAHRFFVENLPVHFLASYLVLLKHAKSMTSSYIGIIVKCLEDEHPWKDVSDIVAQHVSMKTVDPELETLNATVHARSMSDVVFLMVSPALAIGEFWNKPRAQETLFKWLKQIGHQNSEVIRIYDEDDETSTLAEVLVDNIIDRLVYKIKQNIQENEDVRVVLVGWGWTTYAVHRAALLTNGVSAIVSLGFPVLSGIGRRGSADDDILLTYCPTLFVVGADGEMYDNVGMKDLRGSMLSSSGLLVVGHANDNLLVTSNVLIRLGVTQKVVFRLMLERILEFLNLEDTKADRMKLFPPELNNIFNVEPVIFKSEKMQLQAGLPAVGSPASQQLSTSAAVPSPIPSSSSSAMLSGRRATIAGDDVTRNAAQPPMKKKPTPIQTTSQMSPAMVGVQGARQKFMDAMLKKVQIPDDMPKRTISVDGPRPIEKGDLRERSGTTPISFQRGPKDPLAVGPSTSAGGGSGGSAGKSRGPIDPASISLS